MHALVGRQEFVDPFKSSNRSVSGFDRGSQLTEYSAEICNSPQAIWMVKLVTSSRMRSWVHSPSFKKIPGQLNIALVKITEES